MTDGESVDRILNVIRGETFTDVKLPPLPFPNVSSVYTAEFLLDYARTAVLQERKRCAKVCDDLWQQDGTAMDCRDAIRKGE